MSHWSDARVMPETQQLLVVDTSGELLSLFARRRDLMYQISILVAAASSLLRMILGSGTRKFLWIESPTWLAAFLSIAAVVFCLRFVQIHAGIVFNAMRMSVIEATFLGGNLVDDLAKTAQINPRGVSVQVVFVFALIAGVCSGTCSYLTGTSFLWSGLLGASITSWLVLRLWRIHGQIRDDGLRFWRRSEPQIEGELIDLRTHYVESLKEAHADMLCVTAVVALTTFATVNAILVVENAAATAGNEAFLGPILFGLISTILGLFGVRIYGRLEGGIATFCNKLRIAQTDLVNRSFSDVTLGFCVISGLATFNFVTLVAASTRHLSTAVEAGSEIVTAAIGVVVFSVGCVRHKRLMKKHIQELKASASTVEQSENE